MNVKSKAGFSLVELMVVVAIIGVLATVAVPQYTKFTNRAKQSSAKSELSGLSTAQRSFFLEYNQYHSNLAFVGYIPEGIVVNAANNCPTANYAAGKTRLYSVGFSGAGAVASNAAVNGTAPPCAAIAITFADAIRYDAAQNNTAAPAAATVLSSAPAALAGATVASTTTFTAQARARLSSFDDVWEITHDNAMRNTTPGI